MIFIALDKEGIHIKISTNEELPPYKRGFVYIVIYREDGDPKSNTLQWTFAHKEVADFVESVIEYRLRTNPRYYLDDLKQYLYSPHKGFRKAELFNPMQLWTGREYLDKGAPIDWKNWIETLLNPPVEVHWKG